MLWTLLLAGCLGGRAVQRLADPLPVEFAGLLQDTRPAPLPRRLVSAVDLELRRRNLRPTHIDQDRAVEAFASLREPSRRLAWAARAAGGEGLVIVVVASPLYYGLMDGRYRWVVGVDIELARASSSGAASPASERFEVPVFLDYYRQRGPEATAAASPVIARRLGLLLDRVLGASGEP